jgi:hypothetical protein
MKPLEDVVCCMVDFGLFNELAVQASQHYKHIFYWNPSWANAFPSSKDVTISSGFENITVIKDFWEYKKYLDMVWFPDIYMGDLQEELKAQRIPVWGAGRTEWLERDRFKTTEWMQSVGLPTPERKKIIGIDELRKLPKGWHIKLDEMRDDAETFKRLGNPLMDAYWDALALTLGHRKHTYEFMAEKDIPDAVEFGADIYQVKGEFPNYGLWGLEQKGCGYIGKISRIESLPAPLKKVNDKLSVVFREEETACDFSTEVRCTKKEGFLIDPCMRKGNPPHQSQMEIIPNQAEIAWAGSNGELVQPKIKARYCAQVTMCSEFATTSEVAFEFPESIRKFVKIKNVAKHDGVYYYIPNRASKIETVGAILGLGDSMDEATEQCKKNVSQVKAFRLEVDTHALDDAKEEIIKAKSFGINF